MIEDVKRCLAERKILPESGCCPFNIFCGRTLLLIFYPEGGIPVAAKVTRQADGDIENLRHEYEVLQEQLRLYPGLAPAPVAFEATDDFSCLVMQKLAIRPTALDEFGQADPNSLATFVDFLTGRARRDDGLKAPAPLFEEAVAMLPTELKAEAARYAGKRAWADIIANLVRVPQHCDLAINNIGFDGNAIAVFDWEDYGAVNAAGLDYFVLILSGSGFDYARFCDFAENQILGDNATGWAAEIGAEIGVGRDNMFDLAAIFALLFYGIKCSHGYGQEVRGYILDFLREHFESGPDSLNRAG